MDRHIFFLGNAALSWSSHRQYMVATSSTEYELVILIEATDEAKQLATFLTKLGHDPRLVPIMEDNKGTAGLAL
ncbi:unnamed protein product [Discosporangium mesarthrocarpum]